MNVLLLNDTRGVHSGSNAVMRSILDICKGHRIVGVHRVNCDFIPKDSLERCDIVLCNGEGTIHHRALHGKFLLETLQKAQLMNKKTVLINALFQESTPYYKDVFENLDLLVVRDPLSYINAVENGGRPLLMLDSCVAARDWAPLFSFRKLTGVVKGKVHRDCHHRAILKGFDYKRVVLPKIPFLNDYASFIQSIKTLDLYITGEYHAVYAAGIAGIPFVPIASNSYKIEALIDWSGAKIPTCNTVEDIKIFIDSHEDRASEFKKFSHFLHHQPYLKVSDLDQVLN